MSTNPSGHNNRRVHKTRTIDRNSRFTLFSSSLSYPFQCSRYHWRIFLAEQPALFQSNNLWSNVCSSDIEELLRYSTLYIKSFSTLQFNLFIRINYEIVFHKSATFIYILCWELSAAWSQCIERFDDQLDRIQTYEMSGWTAYE